MRQQQVNLRMVKFLTEEDQPRTKEIDESMTAFMKNDEEPINSTIVDGVPLMIESAMKK